MMFPRRGGILLHPTLLPGRFGIGDLGDACPGRKVRPL
jgi:4-alpha-glucanotransferase